MLNTVFFDAPVAVSKGSFELADVSREPLQSQLLVGSTLAGHPLRGEIVGLGRVSHSSDRHSNEVKIREGMTMRNLVQPAWELKRHL